MGSLFNVFREKNQALICLKPHFLTYPPLNAQLDVKGCLDKTESINQFFGSLDLIVDAFFN